MKFSIGQMKKSQIPRVLTINFREESKNSENLFKIAKKIQEIFFHAHL